VYHSTLGSRVIKKKKRSHLGGRRREASPGVLDLLREVGSDGPVHGDVGPRPLFGDIDVVVVSNCAVRRAETVDGDGAVSE